MREIKFRAWRHGRFVYISGAYDFSYWSCDASNGPNTPITDYGWQQYTGLTDKNGVEIYEGDLIELHNNKHGCVQVCFKNAYVGGWVLAEDKERENYISLGARNTDDLEVIGNIYENPELIKDNQ